jgi:hypothetical protein
VEAIKLKMRERSEEEAAEGRKEGSKEGSFSGRDLARTRISFSGLTDMDKPQKDPLICFEVKLLDLKFFGNPAVVPWQTEWRAGAGPVQTSCT